MLFGTDCESHNFMWLFKNIIVVLIIGFTLNSYGAETLSADVSHPVRDNHINWIALNKIIIVNGNEYSWKELNSILHQDFISRLESQK